MRSGVCVCACVRARAGVPLIEHFAKMRTRPRTHAHCEMSIAIVICAVDFTAVVQSNFIKVDLRQN